MNKTVVIFGAGVTGLTAGIDLMKSGGFKVFILEKTDRAGGLAKTMQQGPNVMDVGSHRIHTNYAPEALSLIRDVLGPDLLKRPRLGEILINKKFIAYPPTLPSILRVFGLLKTIVFLRDWIWAKITGPFFFLFQKKNFETYLISRLGQSLYRSFYRPYGFKLWAMDPALISTDPAKNRTKRFSPQTIMREIIGLFQKKKTNPFYFYPRKGIGQISEKLREEFEKLGGEIILQAGATRLERGREGISRVEIPSALAPPRGLSPDIVLSTIPLKDAIRLFVPPAPPPSLSYRGIKLVFLSFTGNLASPCETIYIPDPDFKIARVSNPERYSPDLKPKDGRLWLTAEIICSPGDKVTRMPEEEISKLCEKELKTLGILSKDQTFLGSLPSIFIPDIYPIYEKDWKSQFQEAIRPLTEIPNLFCAGRSALYLHCNIDDCMVMALQFSRHVKNGGNAKEWWQKTNLFHSFRVKE